MKKDLLGFEFHSHSNFPTKYFSFYSDSRKSLWQNPHKSYKCYCQFHVCSWLLSADQLVVIPLCLPRLCEMTPWWSAPGPGPSPARVSASSLQYYYPGALVSINPSSSHHDVTYWHEKQPPSHAGEWYALIFVVTAVPVAESSPP